MKIPVVGFHLENTTTRSAYYTVLIAENGVVITHWGKIGAAGQFKVEQFPSFRDAEAAGKKVLYTKLSAAYREVDKDVKFSIDEDSLVAACESRRPGGIVAAFHDARRNRADGEKAVVMKHYDDFVETAQRLLNDSERPFEDVFADFEPLRDAWQELSDKHATVATTMSLLEQMLTSRLMSGALQ